MSDVANVWVLNPILFNAAINYMGNSDPQKACWWYRTEEMASTQEGHAATQSDTDRPEKWADKLFTQYNKEQRSSTYGEITLGTRAC